MDRWKTTLQHALIRSTKLEMMILISNPIYRNGDWESLKVAINKGE